MTLLLIMASAAGYLLGSIPTGYLVGRANGIDIRQWGSGATGGTNVLRTLGWKAAIITGAGDLLKGLVAALIGYYLAGDWGYALGALLAAIGHAYPVWLGFRGGKSVATGAGGVLPLHPLAFLAGFVTGMAAIIPTRYVSLGSLVATATASITIWLSDAPLAHKLYLAGLFLVIYVRHWENIKRLAAGKENKFGQQAKKVSES